MQDISDMLRIEREKFISSQHRPNKKATNILFPTITMATHNINGLKNPNQVKLDALLDALYDYDIIGLCETNISEK